MNNTYIQLSFYPENVDLYTVLYTTPLLIIKKRVKATIHFRHIYESLYVQLMEMLTQCITMYNICY